MIYLLMFALGLVAGAILLGISYRKRRDVVTWRIIDLDKEKP